MHAGKFITLTLTILLLGPLAACNTVEGFGRDLENMGQSLQSTAGDETEQAADRNTTRDDSNSRFDQWDKPAVE